MYNNWWPRKGAERSRSSSLKPEFCCQESQLITINLCIHTWTPCSINLHFRTSELYFNACPSSWRWALYIELRKTARLVSRCIIKRRFGQQINFSGWFKLNINPMYWWYPGTRPSIWDQTLYQGGSARWTADEVKMIAWPFQTKFICQY